MTTATPPSKPAPNLVDMLVYPQAGFGKWFYKAPILAYRSGCGFMINRYVCILTATGRKSGQARHTPLLFFNFGGRKYIIRQWPQSDWYKNLQANPLVTMQSSDGTEHFRARNTTPAEREAFYPYFETDQRLNYASYIIGGIPEREEFIAKWEKFELLTFDPTTEPTPEPLKADLAWVWGFAAFAILGRMLRSRRR